MDEVVEAYVPNGAHSPLRQYTKIYHLGDARLSDLLHGSVVIEEKVDGSQFRFGVFGGVLHCGSHRVNFHNTSEAKVVDRNPEDLDNFEGKPRVIADKLFQPAVDYLESIQERIPDDVVFYAETLSKPTHNTVTYGRTPQNFLYLFDAFNIGEKDWVMADGAVIKAGEFASVEVLQKMAAALGTDGPNVMWSGEGKEMDMNKLTALLATQSYLGGAVIEGIVIKNYALESPDPFHPLTMMGGKLVRKSFKEENDANWKAQRDILGQIGMRFQSNARYEKAWVHLREEGKLEGNLRDIKPLMEETRRDIVEEAKPQILEMLWDWYERDVQKMAVAGLPEWYKEKLAKKQLEE